VAPTLVTYNVVLDVYGRMGRLWPWIVALLDEMRVAGVEPDSFIASTVIAACCRDGLVDEAVASTMYGIFQHGP
jgi:pentatricopeptide repeat domain-containing protein 1